MLILIACCGMVLAEEFPILQNQVEIRQAHLEWKGAGHEIGMEATIEYINEISDGAGAVELSVLLNNFKNQSNTAATLTTHVALNNALRQAKQITTSFRMETRQQMKEHKGKGVALMAQIKAVLAAKEGEINSLKDAYWTTVRNNSLETFDMRVERAQEVLNKISDNGYDIVAAQAKLDEIKGKRSGLESALEAKNNAQIRQRNTEILNLSKELRQIVRDLQIQIPQDTRIKHWLHVGDRVVERTATIISELKTLGIDVVELEAIHAQAITDLAKVQSEFDAGNSGGAITALQDLKTTLIELRAAYQELIFGGLLPTNMEVKVGGTISALDNTVTEMEKSIE